MPLAPLADPFNNNNKLPYITDMPVAAIKSRTRSPSHPQPARSRRSRKRRARDDELRKLLAPVGGDVHEERVRKDVDVAVLRRRRERLRKALIQEVKNGYFLIRNIDLPKIEKVSLAFKAIAALFQNLDESKAYTNLLSHTRDPKPNPGLGLALVLYSPFQEKLRFSTCESVRLLSFPDLRFTIVPSTKIRPVQIALAITRLDRRPDIDPEALVSDVLLFSGAFGWPSTKHLSSAEFGRRRRFHSGRPCAVCLGFCGH
uniref:BHLH domain-containing protein n=1 Tax=Steinernema glaseri TaxID=37863 RepID=A0A1I7XZN4_9BILA